MFCLFVNIGMDSLSIIKTDKNKYLVKRMHLYTLQIKLQILVLAACSSAVFLTSDDCTPDYCERAECAQALGCRPDEIMMPNATLCGCCDAC
jgi:hypothetical protein